MSRRELEQAVDRLAEQHSGRDFADAVRRLSEGLDEDEREVLRSVLLERARLLDDAVAERFRVRGWLGRLRDRIEQVERRARLGHDRDR